MTAAARRSLSSDPTRDVAVHRIDDRFIALRTSDLLSAVLEELRLPPAERAAIRQFAEALSGVIEQETDAFIRDLLHRYQLVNPDCDTVLPTDPRAYRCPELYDEIERRVSHLLDKANFERFDDVQLDAVVRAAATHGFHVRLSPDRIESLTIWVRGHGRVTRRAWRWGLKPVVIAREMSVFRRLVVVARLRDDPHVLLKMFKDIPEDDVEALLPHAEVEMNWFDRLRMFGSGAGVLGSTAAKLLFSVAVLSKLLWIVVVGAGTLLVRTILGYRRARVQRDFQRTRHLYYQNLCNNASVIHSLARMTADEEFKEAFLAYTLLAQPALQMNQAGWLGQRASEFLARRLNMHIDFDDQDALRTLRRLDLFAQSDDRVLSPAAATERLRAHWIAARSQNHHLDACAAPPISTKPDRCTP